MSPGRRFSESVLATIADAKIIGIRAGTEPHRFTGVPGMTKRTAGIEFSARSHAAPSNCPRARSRYAPGTRKANTCWTL